MPIKVIVEFQAKPGMRDQLLSTLQAIVQEHGAGLKGYLGSTRYAVVDQPDALVEVAEWESVAARNAHLEHARTTNAFAPLLPLMGAPFRATVLEALPV